MAPEYKQSSRSFEDEKNKSMPAGMSIRDLGDSHLRSFMGHGNARFNINGKVQKGVNGGPDITRRNAIDDIRASLMGRMKEANLDAVAEARRMEGEHRNNFKEMNKHFKLKEATTRKKKTLELKYKYLTGDKKGFIDAVRELNESVNSKYKMPIPAAAPASKIQVQYAHPGAPVAVVVAPPVGAPPVAQVAPVAPVVAQPAQPPVAPVVSQPAQPSVLAPVAVRPGTANLASPVVRSTAPPPREASPAIPMARPASPPLVVVRSAAPVARSVARPAAAAAVSVDYYLSLKDPAVRRAIAAVLKNKGEGWKDANLSGYSFVKNLYAQRQEVKHYVTVIGIKDNGDIKVLDSNGYSGAKVMNIKEFLKGVSTLEMEWISDDLDPSSLLGEKDLLTHVGRELDSLTLTRGDVYSKVMEAGVVESMYIPTPGAVSESMSLDKALIYNPEEAGEDVADEESVETAESGESGENSKSAAAAKMLSAAALSQGGTTTTAQYTTSEDGFKQPAILGGIEGSYEAQSSKNNCYAVTEAALLNHYLAKKKGSKAPKKVGQDDVRNYRPEVRKNMLDTGSDGLVDPSLIHGILDEVNTYAGKGQEAMGNIFSLGDFIMERILKEGLIASLNKAVYSVNFDTQAVTQQGADKVSDKIRSIIEEGAVVGILTIKSYIEGELISGADVFDIDPGIGNYFQALTDDGMLNSGIFPQGLKGKPDSLKQVMPENQWDAFAVDVAAELYGEKDEEPLDVSNDDGASSTAVPVTPSSSPEPKEPDKEKLDSSPVASSTSDEQEEDEEVVAAKINDDSEKFVDSVKTVIEAASEGDSTTSSSAPVGDSTVSVAAPVAVPPVSVAAPVSVPPASVAAPVSAPKVVDVDALLGPPVRRSRASSITAASPAALLPAPVTRQRRNSVSDPNAARAAELAAFKPERGSELQDLLKPTRARLGSTKSEFWKDVVQYSGLYDDLLANIAANRTPYFVERRINSNRKDIDKLTAKEAALDKTIENECSIWRTEYELYKRDVVKKLDEAYDNLAQSWYELTHEYAIETLGQNATQQQISQIMQRRSITGESAKDITEYAGIYDLSSLKSQLSYALKNPYHDLDFDLLVTKAATGYGDSTRQDAPRHSVVHKTFSMYATAPGGNGARTRYVFDSNLQGRRFEQLSRLTQNDRDAYDQNPAAYVQQPAIITLQQLQYAEDFGLDLDEKGANGEFIHSEMNGRLYVIPRKGSKEELLGFYSNGQMIMNERQARGKNGRYSTDADMDMPDAKKVKGAEELRAAIRRSPFFNHVNAATIQLYAEYQAVSEFGNKVNEGLEAAYGQTNRTTTRAANSVNLQQNRAAAFAQISSSLWGDALAAYIEDLYTQNGPGTGALLNNDAVLNHVLTSKKDAVVQAVTILLLEENKPGLWDVAKFILTRHTNLIDFRSRVMLDKLDMSGDLMRTALLNELANHQGAFSEFHPKEDEDLTSFIQIFPQITVWKEEIMNRRDLGARFGQRVVNGEIFKKIFGVASAAAGAGFLGYDADHPDEKLSKEQEQARADGRQNALWAAYGDSVASGTRIMALAEGILGGAGLITNMATGDWSGNSVGNQLRNFGTFGLEDVATFINGAAQIIRIVARIVKRSKDIESGATATELQSKTALADFFKEVVGFGTSLVDMAQALRDLCSNWGLAESELGGYVDRGLKIIREMLDFIDHCIDIHIGRVRKESLAEVDSMIESAVDLAMEQAQRRGNRAAAPARVMTPETAEGRVNVYKTLDPKGLTRQVGEAAMQNSQVQFYLSLTRNATKKGLMRNSYALGRDVVAMTRDALAIGAKATKDPGTLAATAFFTLAPYAIDFARWCHGKIGYDRPNFKQSVAAMLGDPSYAKKMYFDSVLKRETGIVSGDYLVDLARIFTAIDTHVLVTNPQSPGEYELGRTLVSGLYDNVSLATMKKLKLSDMLKFSGFKEGSDWRAVLRHSLTG